ncbi:hypothetical protein FQN54_007911 [Arachnomyces sp. PD_36]|nr:hypothetical protein FQN54_007911 [Arachnomyces sp. PD_36]
MSSTPLYPSDYLRVLQNTFTTDKVNNFLTTPGASTPIFLFGPSMLPSVLKSIIEADSNFNMVEKMAPCAALNHRLYTMNGSCLPVIKPSTEAGITVEGFVVFGLTAEQRNRLQDFESGLARYEIVQVEIPLHDGLTRETRTFDAGAFVWGDTLVGLTASSSRFWKIDDFLGSRLYSSMVRSAARRNLP